MKKATVVHVPDVRFEGESLRVIEVPSGHVLCPDCKGHLFFVKWVDDGTEFDEANCPTCGALGYVEAGPAGAGARGE